MSCFVDCFEDMADAIHENNVEKGFWPEVKTDRNMGEAIALAHSELSEALEGWRDGNPLSEKIGDRGFTQAEEEFADAIIRLMDTGKGFDLNIAGAIEAKHEYNKSRPHKHGREF